MEALKPALTTWCMGLAHPERWPLEKTMAAAKSLGLEALEVVAPEDCPALKARGLVSALTTSHAFTKGMNHRAHWDECLAAYRKAMEANAACGFRTVVSFWGFEDAAAGGGGLPRKISLAEGKRNLVEGYKRIVGEAEKLGQTLVLEPLNTRDPGEWKGHPGYQGADLGDCLEVIRAVGSPSLKLLLDLYHVQIMHGDLIRRIGEAADCIGYVQLAGVPGRHEPDGTQEVNYPAVLRALADSGYRGYVGLEFIPRRDPLESFRAATALFR